MSYFVKNTTLSTGLSYSIVMHRYTHWATSDMSLAWFKQIRSAYHPESRENVIQYGDKCYQIRYTIRQFNDRAGDIFDLGPNAAFDEEGVAMQSRYFPVRQYNKNKPAKFFVEFVILTNSQHYFIYHLDVYQGSNAKNIVIHKSVRHLPTT